MRVPWPPYKETAFETFICYGCGVHSASLICVEHSISCPVAVVERYTGFRESGFTYINLPE